MRNNIEKAILNIAGVVQEIQSRLGDNMDYTLTKETKDILKEPEEKVDIDKFYNKTKEGMVLKPYKPDTRIVDLKTKKNSKKK